MPRVQTGKATAHQTVRPAYTTRSKTPAVPASKLSAPSASTPAQQEASGAAQKQIQRTNKTASASSPANPKMKAKVQAVSPKPAIKQGAKRAAKPATPSKPRELAKYHPQKLSEISEAFYKDKNHKGCFWCPTRPLNDNHIGPLIYCTLPNCNFRGYGHMNYHYTEAPGWVPCPDGCHGDQKILSPEELTCICCGAKVADYAERQAAILRS